MKTNKNFKSLKLSVLWLSLLGLGTQGVAHAQFLDLGDTSFKTEQDIEKDLISKIDESAKSNAKQIELLNELTQRNRTGKTKDDLNLVESMPAEYQIQSKYHPNAPLTAQETKQMIKEGDTGREYPSDYGKIIPNGLSIEPIDNSTLTTNQSNNIIKNNYNQNMAENMSNSYKNLQKPKSINMTHGNFKTPYQSRKDGDLSPTKQIYLGDEQNTIPNEHQYQTTNGYEQETENSGEKRKAIVNRNIAQAKADIVKEVTKIFDRPIMLPHKKEKINSLLMLIAKDNNYQLMIEDKDNMGDKYHIVFKNQKNQTYKTVLIEIGNELKKKGIGELKINTDLKKLKIVYSNKSSIN